MFEGLLRWKDHRLNGSSLKKGDRVYIFGDKGNTLHEVELVGRGGLDVHLKDIHGPFIPRDLMKTKN